MSKMSWFSLESIAEWGCPTEVDSTKLMLHQAKVLVGMVEDLMDNAGFTKKDAVEHAVAAFKYMYEKRDGGWAAKKVIHLKGHGVQVKSKYHRKDQKERIMAKVREEIADGKKCKAAIRSIIEAGRRNSGRDRKAIDQALGGLFDVLNKDDQKAVLKTLGKKLGHSIRYRKEQP